MARLDEITSRSFDFSSLSEEAALSALYSSISASSAAILPFKSAIIKTKSKMKDKLFMTSLESMSSGSQLFVYFNFY